MRLLPVGFVVVTIARHTTPSSAPSPQLFHSPTVSRAQVVFAYEGHLWSVAREGGSATRLTSVVGVEAAPVFSPDGRSVAFAGNYDGNVDVYVVSASGGAPKRLTYHPSVDVPAGWSPDGRRVLFTSTRNSETGATSARLFSIDVDSTFPSQLPLPEVYEGSYSPDARRVAYVPIPRAFATWREYRGGQTTPIWIADLATSRVTEVPRNNSNDFNPMWVGGTIYFLSDRDGLVRLYAYDVASRAVRRIPRERSAESTDDITWASAGPDAIAFEELGSLHLLDLRTQRTTTIAVTVDSDHPETKPREIAVADQVVSAAPSPDGGRVLFEARGKILSLSPASGEVVNLTSSPGATETQPAWSPDGKWIAYFSDESGRYALRLRESATNVVREISLGDSAAYASSPVWSPDNARIAYTDSRRQLWYVDAATGRCVRVAISQNARRENDFAAAWSPDGRWLAYVAPLGSWYRALFVYSMDGGSTLQITDGISDVALPSFDPTGRYLYFAASVDAGPSMSSFDLSAMTRHATRSVYALVLAAGTPGPGTPTAAPVPHGATAIDFENVGRRIVAMPVAARDYIQLAAGDSDVVYLLETTAAGSGPLTRIDLRTRKAERVTQRAEHFALSADRRRMLWWQDGSYFLIGANGPATPDGGRLPVDHLKVTVHPRAEWREMYAEVWRAERELFYDPRYHGVDVSRVQAKYAPFLDSLSSRNDLNYLFQRMLSELRVSHIQVHGGDTPRPAPRPVGLLAADYVVEQGRYRFAKVYRGDPWTPGAAAPLAFPGKSVDDGEFLLAVNGHGLSSADNVYAAFLGLANRPVTIRVGPRADGTNARDVTVVPITSEARLRYVDWVQRNRETVARLSGGKIAYVHLPDTGTEGLTAFDHYYFPQLDRAGMIVDDRFNRGGAEADYVIDYLSRPAAMYESVRRGQDYRAPFGVKPAATALLINERTGSGGEGLAWMFKRDRLGPVIGKRTWGGAVGLDGFGLSDGGEVTIPTHRSYAADGQWIIENQGVSPDIDVAVDPASWRVGRDPQLERAVEVLMRRVNAPANGRSGRPSATRAGAPHRHSGASGGDDR